MQPATRIIVSRLAINPVTSDAGTARIERSARVSAMALSKCMTEWQTLRWVSMTPFGRPVVPEG